MSSDGIDQKLKGVFLLKKAGSGNGEQPCGEELAFLGLVSEADFSPRHRWSDSPLCGVIGWLHTLMFKECEQVIPVFEQTTGSSGHIRDVSGDKGKDNGLTHSWLSSSLKISPEEQIAFLQKLLAQTLPVSSKSFEMTRNILFIEDMADAWKLYGKTGSGYLLNQDGSRNEDRQIGWFVGWVTKGARTIIFAHYIENEEKQDAPAGKRAKDKAREKLISLIQSRG